MPEQTQTRFELHTRELTFRADQVDADQGIISGIGVPYNTPVRIREWWGEEYDEQFAPGSVDDEGALAFWRHREPIGFVASASDTDAGRDVELQISQTTDGRDALTLARDLQRGGRPMEISVGFELGGDFTVEERDGDVPLVTRTRVKALEYSLVPFGAYGEGANVTEVRERQQQQNTRTEEKPMDENETPELISMRERLEELERRQQTLTVREAEPVGDRRSAGAFLQALAAGDEATIAAYNRSQEYRHDELQHRAYTGGTTADAPVQDAWVGDLTRIFDASSGLLSRIFSTGTLPATGMNVEFAELLANTVQVTEQVAEGDDLAYGKVTLQNRTAPVKTYGGYTQLSRQQIERSTLPVLNQSLRALAVAAGARKKAALRAAYATLVAAREAIAANAGVLVLGATLSNSKEKHWTDLVIDAAIRFDALDLPIDAMLVSPHVFKHLKNAGNIETVAVEEGEQAVGVDRAFRLSSAAPSVGTLNLPGLTGDLAGLTVACDPGFSSAQASLVSAEALRQYDSALVSLQDENIINLSKDFSVYRYGAVAAEIPTAVVPVKLAAS